MRCSRVLTSRIARLTWRGYRARRTRQSFACTPLDSEVRTGYRSSSIRYRGGQMDTLRDEYFSPADAEEWLAWDEGLLEQEQQDIDAYLTTLLNYYGNQRCG